MLPPMIETPTPAEPREPLAPSPPPTEPQPAPPPPAGPQPVSLPPVPPGVPAPAAPRSRRGMLTAAAIVLVTAAAGGTVAAVWHPAASSRVPAPVTSSALPDFAQFPTALPRPRAGAARS